MKVLWVSSQILNPIGAQFGQPASGLGGWVVNMLERLLERPELSLSIAMPGPVDSLCEMEWRGVKCFILPSRGATREVDANLALQVVEKVCPDLVQIEGTEFGIHSAFAKIDGVRNLVSLQGILHGYEPYFLGGLNINRLMFSGNPKVVVSGLAMAAKKRLAFGPRARHERETLRAAQNFLGRTEWDRAHSYFQNPSAPYFTCRRILRAPFYEKRWSADRCSDHTLFVGNGYSPLKGLHNVVEAVAKLAGEFPHVRVRVAGVNPLVHQGKKGSQLGYPMYLRQLMRTLKVEDKFVFLGMLDAEGVSNELAKAHVYVLPSLIENSPNTLGEAMLMGVPSVISYAGGVTDMGSPGKDFLMYRPSDSTMLAWNVKKIMNSRNLAVHLSTNAQRQAAANHDPAANSADLLSAYRAIVDG